ncbi:metallophosphoesterase [Agrobacterium sp.]|jgi:serine/threonine protein phosphatase 1|uniref:metallophosphoesterase n=1 Tax=Agrobacterium sp. TaxID=361 RepID=UPI0028B0B621|nr:metallophosphoesterase [Agrobacterium sp.]
MIPTFQRLFGAKTVQQAVPESRRQRIDLGSGLPQYPIYAIGDVHGRIDLLQHAESLVAGDLMANGKSGIIVLLGDYVDRGKSSSAVLDYLCAPSPYGLQRFLVCGNHDDAFLQFFEDPARHLNWLDFGGRQTLLSYGIDADYMLSRGKNGIEDLKRVVNDTIPVQHIQLLRDMVGYIRIGSYIFVHAGLRPGVALTDQDDRDLMWIREPFLSRGPELPFLVVHGHTVTEQPETGRNRIGIDTGAVNTNRLTVLKLEDGKGFLIS